MRTGNPSPTSTVGKPELMQTQPMGEARRIANNIAKLPNYLAAEGAASWMTME